MYIENKEIIHKKEEIKCINILKHYKEWLTIIVLKKN